MKKCIFLLLFLASFITEKISLAEDNFSQQSDIPSGMVRGSDGNLYYDTNSYNIFTAPLWVVEPYLSFSYSFNVGDFKNNGAMNYKSALDKINHGFNIGTGIFLNHNYGFGISFTYLTKVNKVMANEFDKITTEIFLLNFDFMLKLPFTFKGFRTYGIFGMNAVFAELKHHYTADMIPASTAQMNKTSFGLNVGLGLEYKIIEHLYAKFDFRRVFVFKGIVNDFWLFQFGLTAQF